MSEEAMRGAETGGSERLLLSARWAEGELREESCLAR